jgi:SAM-dependent methyltransferase
MPCRACGHELPDAELDAYAICGACGSANYISLASAEKDNALYFDEVYSDSDRLPIAKRYKLFERFERIHRAFHAKEEERFRAVVDRMSQHIRSARMAVEIGFGSGHELVRHLEAGANMYGMDISHQAVTNFKESHPEFSDRVEWGDKVAFQVDVLYANALFEHLDDPGGFLGNAGSQLPTGGLLLLRLPVITADAVAREDLDGDINFWKPCHRVLYSRRGLDALFNAHGFTITESAPLAYYGYKVMSSMLRHGHMDIARVRNPFLPIAGLTAERQYFFMLLEALFRTLVCSDYAIVARKVW